MSEKNYTINDQELVSELNFNNVSVQEMDIMEQLNKYSDKSQVISMVLCIVFPGAHYYYVGRKKMGILFTCTLGFMMIGTFIDFFRIATGKLTDNTGRKLNDPQVFYWKKRLEEVRKFYAEKRKNEGNIY